MQHLSTLIFLASLLGSASASNEYSDSGRMVTVSMESVSGTGSDLSNIKCVEYNTGMGADFTEGCFSTIYNVNEKVVGCDVAFDGEKCNSCTICITTDEPPILGYNIDCQNRLPEKTTKSFCTPLVDGNVQDLLLVSGHFPNTDFVFDSTADVPTMAPGTGTSSVAPGSGMVFVAAGVTLAALGAAIL
jgi:hypothetical protein